MVNTSHYRLRYRQEGSKALPAGTCSKSGDGSQSMYANQQQEGFHFESPPPPSSQGPWLTCWRVTLATPDLSVLSVAQRELEDCEACLFLASLPVAALPRFSSPAHKSHTFPCLYRLLIIGDEDSLHALGGRGSRHSSSRSRSQTERVRPVSSGVASPDRCDRVSPASLLSEELSLKQLTELAYMFNFNEGSLLEFGEKKICVQVEESDWSKPFSLESIGMSQVLTTRHTQKGVLEVGFSITVPPGRLGLFTKVIQFWPRFLVVNRLERPLALEQNTNLRQGSKRVSMVPPGASRPFHLPQFGGERELRLRLAGGWAKSASFPVDPGVEYTLRLHRRRKLASLQHIDTRVSAEYEVILPPKQPETGLWMETDWYRQQTVVKDVKKNTYAFNHTEIQVGDVLLSINGREVYAWQFSEVMQELKRALRAAEEPVVLKFRTMEERYRLLRAKALRGRAVMQQKTFHGDENEVMAGSFDYASPDAKQRGLDSGTSQGMKDDQSDLGKHAQSCASELWHDNSDTDEEGQDQFDEVGSAGNTLASGHRGVRNSQEEMFMRVELRPMAASVVLVISALERTEAPYVIENIDSSHRVYFRQKGAENHPWICVRPGEKAYYTWEDPMSKGKRLMVRVGPDQVWQGSGASTSNIGGKIWGPTWQKLRGWGLGIVQSEEEGTRTGAVKLIKLDEIGSEEKLPLPEWEGNRQLHAKVVHAEGPTRYLLITSHKDLRKSIEAFKARKLGLQHTSNQVNLVLTKYKRYLEHARRLEEEARDDLTILSARPRSMSLRCAYIDLTPMMQCCLPYSVSTATPPATCPHPILPPSFSFFLCGHLDPPEREMLRACALSRFKHHQGHRALPPPTHHPWHTCPSYIYLVHSFQCLNLKKIQESELALGVDEEQIKRVVEAEDCLTQAVEDVHIDGENQLLVEVIAAQGLRASNLDGYSSNPYCVVYVKMPDSKACKELKSQRGQTYFLEKTLSPTWLDQKYVFKLPPEAARSKRGFSVRVLVLSRDLFHLNDFLGQATVPLSLLQDQKERLGWFPLTRKSSHLMHLGTGDSIYGSINLRLRWIHSTPAFLEDRVQSLTQLMSDVGSRMQRTERLLEHLKLEQRRVSKKKRMGVQVTAMPERGRATRLRKRLEKFTLIGSPVHGRPARPTSPFFKLDSGIYGSLDSPVTRSSLLGLLRDGQKDSVTTPSEIQRLSSQLSFREAASIGDRNSRNERMLTAPARSGSHQRLIKRPHSSVIFVPTSKSRDGPLQGIPLCGSQPRLSRRTSFLLGQAQAHTSVRIGSAHGPRRVASTSVTLMRDTIEESPQSHGADTFPGMETCNSSRMGMAKLDPLADFKLKAAQVPILQRPTLKQMMQRSREALVCEMDLTHRRVMASGGTLLIKPLQACNILDGSKKVYVAIKTHCLQGVVTWESERAGATKPQWKAQEKPFRLDTEAMESNARLELSLFAESSMTDMKGDVEVGRLEVSLGALIDCCSFKARFEYQRWFPLHDPAVSSSSVFWTSTACHFVIPTQPQKMVLMGSDAGLLGDGSEQRSAGDFPSHLSIIQLTIKWLPKPRMASDVTRSYISAQLGDVSACLIDNERAQELLHLSVSGVDIRYAESVEYTRVSTVINWLQLDNQANQPAAPVMLGATPVTNQQPLLQLCIIKNNSKSHPRLHHFEYISALLQELDVRLEQAVITDIVQFVVDSSHPCIKIQHVVFYAGFTRLAVLSTPHLHPTSHIRLDYVRSSSASSGDFTPTGARAGTTEHKRSAHDTSVSQGTADMSRSGIASSGIGAGMDSSTGKTPTTYNVPGPSHAAADEDEGLSQQARADGMHLYVEVLYLHPIKLNFSFIKNADIKRLFRLLNQREDKMERMAGGGSFEPQLVAVNHSIVSNFPRLLLEFVINLTNDINSSTVKLNALQFVHVWKTPQGLAHRLQSHYIGALLRQLYKVVGSFDFLGDPIGVFSQVGTGVKDFFYEPAEGLMKSPSAFGRGVAKGTMSLVGNTTSGVLGFTTKITRSVGGGVAMMSFDDEFQRKRIQIERQHRQGPKSTVRLIGRAVRDLGGGVYDGVTGLVLEPYKGLRDEGIRGFLVGCCHGIAGIATKPMVGCLDAVTHTGEAAREMAGGLAPREVLRQVERKRFPQPFGLDNRLMKYSKEVARGADILSEFPPKTKYKYASTSLEHTRERDLGPEYIPAGEENAHDGVLSILSDDEDGSEMRPLGVGGGTGIYGRGAKPSSKKREKPTKDYVVLAEFLQRSQAEVTVVVISNTRLLCVTAELDGGKYSRSLDWEIPFDCMLGAPDVIDEGTGGLTLDFTSALVDEKREGKKAGRLSIQRNRGSDLGLSRSPKNGIGSRLQQRLGQDKATTIQRIWGSYRDRTALVNVYNAVSRMVQLHHQEQQVKERLPGQLAAPGLIGSVHSRWEPMQHNCEFGQAGTLIVFNGWEFGAEGGDSALSFGTGRIAADSPSRSGIKSPISTFTTTGGTQISLYDVWLLLRYNVPGWGLKICPQAYEMDAVRWRASEKLSEQKPPAPWRSAALRNALEAPEHLGQLVIDSDPSYLDGPRLISLKEDVRQGRITGAEFSRLLELWIHEPKKRREYGAPVSPAASQRSATSSLRETRERTAAMVQGGTAYLRRLSAKAKPKLQSLVGDGFVGRGASHSPRASGRTGASDARDALLTHERLGDRDRCRERPAIGSPGRSSHSGPTSEPYIDSRRTASGTSDVPGAMGPTTAELYENISSVSHSQSTAAITDLSTRLEKIEDLLGALLGGRTLQDNEVASSTVSEVINIKEQLEEVKLIAAGEQQPRTVHKPQLVGGQVVDIDLDDFHEAKDHFESLPSPSSLNNALPLGVVERGERPLQPIDEGVKEEDRD
ncbi:unnamed protein product [Chrysoparadoxa australica]